MNTHSKYPWFAKILDDVVTLAKICTPLALLFTLALVSTPKVKADDLKFNPDLGGRTITLPTSEVDYEKLAKAIALHETSNCGITYGAARYNNCFGFRTSEGFMHFKTKQASYDKFHKLWKESYGGGFPTMRQATTWVCGNDTPTGHDCHGGSPSGWLSSVSSIYENL
jgi:hypothetical protein